jgi:hypothetical protein
MLSKCVCDAKDQLFFSRIIKSFWSHVDLDIMKIIDSEIVDSNQMCKWLKVELVITSDPRFMTFHFG